MSDQYFQAAMREILDLVDDNLENVAAVLTIMKLRHPRVPEDDLKLLILEAKSQR